MFTFISALHWYGSNEVNFCASLAQQERERKKKKVKGVSALGTHKTSERIKGKIRRRDDKWENEMSDSTRPKKGSVNSTQASTNQWCHSLPLVFSSSSLMLREALK